MKKYRIILTLIFFLFASSVLYSHDLGKFYSKNFTKCIKKAIGDFGLNNCTLDELEIWDSKLNKTYRAIIRTHKNVGEYDKKIVKLLVISQKSWIHYKEKKCKLHFVITGEGTLAKVSHSSCLLDMTIEKYLELKKTFKK